MSKIFHTHLEKETLDNKDYRRVLYTDRKIQIVVMSLLPAEDIEMEIHSSTSQFIRVEKGKGVLQIKEDNKITKYKLYDGVAVTIPPNTHHRVVNNGTRRLKLYTIYSPPEHKDKLVQKTKLVEKTKSVSKKLSKTKTKTKDYFLRII